MPHTPRPPLAARYPVHITVRMRRDVPNLRRWKIYRQLWRAFVLGCQKPGFRLVHYSVQRTHIHLLCEGRDRQALSRGVQGFAIRVARAVNRVAGRRGKVFADRYHARVLKTPGEARRGLCYVLQNWRRHGQDRGVPFPERQLDPFSSAAHFEGWKQRGAGERAPPGDRPVAAAKTWLLREGWRRAGPLGVEEIPRGPRS